MLKQRHLLACAWIAVALASSVANSSIPVKADSAANSENADEPDGGRTSLSKPFDQFDLASIKLGMTGQAAIAALQAQGYNVTEGTFSYKVAPDRKIRRAIVATRNSPVAPAINDQVTILLSLPPFAEKVLGISKELVFAENGAPLVSGYLDGAVDKAGFETFREPPPYTGRILQMIQWKEGEVPVREDKALKSFSHFLGNPPHTTECAENPPPIVPDNDFTSSYFDAIRGGYSLTLRGVRNLRLSTAPKANCGITYIAHISYRNLSVQNARALTQIAIGASMSLIDQQGMVVNAKAHGAWLAAATRAYNNNAVKNAAKPQM